MGGDVGVDLGRLLEVGALVEVHRISIARGRRIVDGDVVRDLGVGGRVGELREAGY